MNTILSELDAWGCDVTGALKRCFGDTEFYLRWVKEFSSDPGFEKLDRELQMKKYTDAFRTAHGLKGDSGMLGLTPLFLSICPLVEDLRNERLDSLDEDYGHIKCEYEKFVDILRHV